MKTRGERHRTEVAHDEFEQDFAQTRSGRRLRPGEVHRRAAEDYASVHEDRVDDVSAEAVVAQVVAEDVEAYESHAADARVVVIQCSHAIGVQALEVELEVGDRRLLQSDAPLASFLPVTSESRAEELRGLDGEGSVDGEVLLFFAIAAHAYDEGVEEVVATTPSVTTVSDRSQETYLSYSACGPVIAGSKGGDTSLVGDMARI